MDIQPSTDTLFIFGGQSNIGLKLFISYIASILGSSEWLNDLWSYCFSTKIWTWYLLIALFLHLQEVRGQHIS